MRIVSLPPSQNKVGCESSSSESTLSMVASRKIVDIDLTPKRPQYSLTAASSLSFRQTTRRFVRLRAALRCFICSGETSDTAIFFFRDKSMVIEDAGDAKTLQN